MLTAGPMTVKSSRVPAHFADCADAQRAADVHELDLYPSAKTIDDGSLWLPDPEIDWRSTPG